jgi:ketosteroid isomerase-like protein
VGERAPRLRPAATYTPRPAAASVRHTGRGRAGIAAARNLTKAGSFENEPGTIRNRIMSALRVAGLPLLVLVALAGCEMNGAEPAGPATHSDTIIPVRAGPAEDAADNLRARFLEAETPDGRASLFTEDGFLLLDETEMLVGRERIRDHYEQLAEEPQPVIEFEPVEAEASGSLAIERGRLTQRFLAEGGEEIATVEGKYLLVLRLEQGDGWRIRGAVMQSEEPPPHRRGRDDDS